MKFSLSSIAERMKMGAIQRQSSKLKMPSFKCLLSVPQATTTSTRSKTMPSSLSFSSSSATTKSTIAVIVGVLVLSLVDLAVCDYENTWNFYYEQPCCGGSTNSHHHIRHHRGNCYITVFMHFQRVSFLFYLLICRYVR